MIRQLQGQQFDSELGLCFISSSHLSGFPLGPIISQWPSINVLLRELVTNLSLAVNEGVNVCVHGASMDFHPI